MTARSVLRNPSSSLFRDTFPRELFATLRKSGRTIEEKYPGVYYVHGNTLFDTQIVVTSRLNGESHYTFRILSKNAKREDVRKFLKNTVSFTSPGDKANADAVFQVSIAANQPLYNEIRKESDMCQAMEELMKDVIDARVEERAALLAEEKAAQIIQQTVKQAEQRAEQRTDKNTALRMYKKGMSVEMIAELVDRSADLVRQWISPAAV